MPPKKINVPVGFRIRRHAARIGKSQNKSVNTRPLVVPRVFHDAIVRRISQHKIDRFRRQAIDKGFGVFIEYEPHSILQVRVSGFEPLISYTQSKRSTKLSYTLP